MATDKNKAIFLGGIFSIVLIIIAFSSFEEVLSAGTMNTGHSDITCKGCHVDAQGTMRQQAQAKIKYWLSLRHDDVVFGKNKVTNEVCVGCHERPNDTHPVYRFFEPRFAEARKTSGAHECVSCHNEHNGVRVTKQDIIYCQDCHKDLEIKNDTISTSHKDLILNKQWDSCLGCHDYHGNHEMKVKKNVEEKLTINEIKKYLNGGHSPYSENKTYLGKKQ